MEGVDRHDNGLLLRPPHHKDADPAGSQTHRIVGHSGENKVKQGEGGLRGRRAGFWTHLGPCRSSR